MWGCLLLFILFWTCEYCCVTVITSSVIERNDRKGPGEKALEDRSENEISSRLIARHLLLSVMSLYEVWPWLFWWRWYAVCGYATVYGWSRLMVIVVWVPLVWQPTIHISLSTNCSPYYPFLIFNSQAVISYAVQTSRNYYIISYQSTNHIRRLLHIVDLPVEICGIFEERKTWVR